MVQLLKPTLLFSSLLNLCEVTDISEKLTIEDKPSIQYKQKLQSDHIYEVIELNQFLKKKNPRDLKKELYEWTPI